MRLVHPASVVTSRRRSWCLSLAFAVVAIGLRAPASAAPPTGAKPTPLAVKLPTERKTPVSFANEVADILAAKCTGCHSDVLAENRLKLEDVKDMIKGGKRGPALVPGKADESLLFTMAAHRVDPVMPQKDKKDTKPLTSEELGLLKLWIDAGAKDDSAEASEEARPIELGELPPGIHPVVAVDMTADGSKVACGRANVVHVYDADSGLELTSLGGHKDIVQSIRFSPNGRLLAAGGFQTVTLWNVPQVIPGLVLTGHTDQVKAIDTLTDGSTVVSAGLDKTVIIWNKDKPYHKYTLPAPLLSMAANRDGSRVVLGGADNMVRLYDIAIGGRLPLIAEFKGHTAAVNSVAVLHDEQGLNGIVSASADGTIRIWAYRETERDKITPPRILDAKSGPVRVMVLDPIQDRVLAGYEDGRVRIWSLENGKLLTTIEAHKAPVQALAYQEELEEILTGSPDGSAHLFDAKTGKLRATYGGHSGGVTAVAFLYESRATGWSEVVTGGADGAIKVWEKDPARGIVAMRHGAATGGAASPVNALRPLGTGEFISASADKTLRTWKVEGRWTERRPLGPHASRVLALDFNPDGTLLAAGGGDPSRSGEIKLWEVGKGMLVRTLDGVHSDTVFGLRFSPDGARLASAGADKFMKVTQVADGKEIRAYEGHTHHVMGVDWKPDGKQLISCGADNVLKLWDAESGEQVRTMQGAGKQITAIRWVPGKPRVAGASGDKVVRYWNPDSGTVAQAFNGAGDYVFGVATNADGSRVAAGGADGVLFVWNGQNGQVVRRFEPPSAPAPKR
ncbi:MAG: c-type cytochrome domain-containing protein [Isosphaeraceae bacterium]